MTSSAPTPRRSATRASRCWCSSRCSSSCGANGLDAPDDLTAAPIGDGHSNVTFVLSTGVVLRRPPRGPLPPSAHDVLREAQAAARARADAGTGARGAGRVRRRVGDRRALLRDGRGRGRRDHRLDARAARHSRAARPGRRRADRLARRAALGRLERGRSRGLRQADRVPGAPAAAVHRAVGAQPHARASREVEEVGQLAGGEHARLPAGDDRPRRLPPRQHDVRARSPGAAGRDPRLGDGDDRRPARRRRLHDDPLDPARRRAGPLQPAQRHHAATASPAARS